MSQASFNPNSDPSVVETKAAKHWQFFHKILSAKAIQGPEDLYGVHKRRYESLENAYRILCEGVDTAVAAKSGGKVVPEINLVEVEKAIGGTEFSTLIGSLFADCPEKKAFVELMGRADATPAEIEASADLCKAVLTKRRDELSDGMIEIAEERRFKKFSQYVHTVYEGVHAAESGMHALAHLEIPGFALLSLPSALIKFYGMMTNPKIKHEAVREKIFSLGVESLRTIAHLGTTVLSVAGNFAHGVSGIASAIPIVNLVGSVMMLIQGAMNLKHSKGKYDETQAHKKDFFEKLDTDRIEILEENDFTSQLKEGLRAAGVLNFNLEGKNNFDVLKKIAGHHFSQEEQKTLKNHGVFDDIQEVKNFFKVVASGNIKNIESQEGFMKKALFRSDVPFLKTEIGNQIDKNFKFRFSADATRILIGVACVVFTSLAIAGLLSNPVSAIALCATVLTGFVIKGILNHLGNKKADIDKHTVGSGVAGHEGLLKEPKTFLSNTQDKASLFWQQAKHFFSKEMPAGNSLFGSVVQFMKANVTVPFEQKISAFAASAKQVLGRQTGLAVGAGPAGQSTAALVPVLRITPLSPKFIGQQKAGAGKEKGPEKEGDVPSSSDRSGPGF